MLFRSPTKNGSVLITKEYADTTYGGTFSPPTGLEVLTESGDTGWRLIGRDPAYYGDIGGGAVDLSFQDGTVTNGGATGNWSYSEGMRVKSTGQASHAEGEATEAIGTNSHAEGWYTNAEGESSHAEGIGSKTTTRASHAEGEWTEASGGQSHSEGLRTKAEGVASHAEGKETTALNESSHAAGRYNVGISDETIHETGIGENNTGKVNAFEIYGQWSGGKLPNWGAVVAPEMTNQIITDFPTDRVLVTKEYADANYNNGGGTTNTLLTGTSLGLWEFLGNNLQIDPASGEYLNVWNENAFKVHKLDVNGNDNSGTLDLYKVGDLFGFVYPEDNTERFYYALLAIDIVGDVYKFTYNPSPVLSHITVAQIIGNNYILSAYFK